MANSDVGRSFRAGLSIGADLGDRLAQASAVFEDRAQKAKAKQVSLEVNKQIEAARAPVAAAKEQMRATADRYGKAGTDVPDEELWALKQNLLEAQGNEALAILEISMNTIGANLGNKYIEEDMGKLGSLAMATMQNLSAQAMQREELQYQMGERDWRSQEAEKAFGRQKELEGMGQQNDLARIQAQGEQTRLNIAAQGAQDRQTRAGKGLDWSKLPMIDEEVEKRLAQRQGDVAYWEEYITNLGGDPDDPENAARAQRHMRAVERWKLAVSTVEDPKTVEWLRPADPEWDVDERDAAHKREVRSLTRLFEREQEPTRKKLLQERIAETEADYAEQREARLSGEDVVSKWDVGVRKFMDAMVNVPEVSSPSGDPYSRPQSTTPNTDKVLGDQWRGQAQEQDRETGEWRDAPRTPGDEFPAVPAGVTWKGKPVRRARKGSWNKGGNLVTDDGPVPPEVEAEMLRDFHERGQTAPWMRQ